MTGLAAFCYTEIDLGDEQPQTAACGLRAGHSGPHVAEFYAPRPEIDVTVVWVERPQ